MLEQAIFLLIAFIAATISATFGIGAAMLLLPFAAILLPVKQAIAITTIYFIVAAGSKAWVFRKDTDWKLVGLLWLGAVPTVIIGARLLVDTPTTLIQTLLAVAIIAYVLKEYTGWKADLKPSNGLVVGVGGAYGLLSGLVGDGSLVRAVLLTRMGVSKEAFIAAMATSALLPNIIKAAIYTRFELLSTTDIPLLLGLSLAALLGTFAGKRLVKRVSKEQFKKIILIILVLVAVKLLYNSFMA